MNRIANFATCLGKYDATVRGNSALTDIKSVAVGSADMSFNSGYVVNSTVYTMPDVSNGFGVSFSGWIFPNGSQTSSIPYAPILDISTNGLNHLAVYLSGGSTPALVGTFNGTTVTTTDICNNIVNYQWNHFCYTIECSGSGVAVQRLHVNGVFNAGVNVQGTYAKQQWMQTNMGFGVGRFAAQFKGKIDDMRSYNRVLTPMEIAVLYRYPYQKQLDPSYPAPALASIPSVAVISATSESFVILAVNTLTLDASASVFSYLCITRSPSFLGGVAMYVPASSLQKSTQSWSLCTWSDTSVLIPLTTYTYTIIPYVMGTAASTGVNITVTTPDFTPIPTVTLTGTYSTASSGSYSKIHTFTGNGTILFTGSKAVQILIVGGGGGGGGNTTSDGHGGGGGGGVAVGSLTLARNITYTIAVGNGGIGSSGAAGTNGGNSSITGGSISEIAYGGGFGGTIYGTGASNGGCGGGGVITANSGLPGSATKGTGTFLTYLGNGGQGNGVWTGGRSEGGGGGGAGPTAPTSNLGGNGYTWTTVTGLTYAGGGAGGPSSGYSSQSAPILGGTGGGGNSCRGCTTAFCTATYYGGGGGGTCGGIIPGGSGYKGVVIIAYND